MVNTEIRNHLTGYIDVAIAELLPTINPDNFDYRWWSFNDSVAIGWQYLVGKQFNISTVDIVNTLLMTLCVHKGLARM